MAGQFDVSVFDGDFDPEDPLRWVDLSDPDDAAAYLFYQTWPKLWECLSDEGKAEDLGADYRAGYPCIALSGALGYAEKPLPRSVVDVFEQSDRRLIEQADRSFTLYDTLERAIARVGIDESK